VTVDRQDEIISIDSYSRLKYFSNWNTRRCRSIYENSIYYTVRGNNRVGSGYKKGAIEDLNIAAKLFQAQNDRSNYEKVMMLIRGI
jgi:hypothetical protein